MLVDGADRLVDIAVVLIEPVGHLGAALEHELLGSLPALRSCELGCTFGKPLHANFANRVRHRRRSVDHHGGHPKAQPHQGGVGAHRPVEVLPGAVSGRVEHLVIGHGLQPRTELLAVFPAHRLIHLGHDFRMGKELVHVDDGFAPSQVMGHLVDVAGDHAKTEVHRAYIAGPVNRVALAGGRLGPLVLEQHVRVLGLLGVDVGVQEAVVHHRVVAAGQVAMVGVHGARLDHIWRHSGLAPLQFSNLGTVLSDGVPDPLHELPFGR